MGENMIPTGRDFGLAEWIKSICLYKNLNNRILYREIFKLTLQKTYLAKDLIFLKC